MIISEVLDAIDNINSITIESEISMCESLLSSYDKILIIKENYNGNDINDFSIVQEGVLSDAKDDVKKKNEGKSTLNKILFTIPRMIIALFQNIFKKKIPEKIPEKKYQKKDTGNPEKTEKKIHTKHSAGEIIIASLTAGVVAGTAAYAHDKIPGNAKEKFMNILDIKRNVKGIIDSLKIRKQCKEVNELLKEYNDIKYCTEFKLKRDENDYLVIVLNKSNSIIALIDELFKYIIDDTKENGKKIINVINGINNKDHNPTLTINQARQQIHLSALKTERLIREKIDKFNNTYNIESEGTISEKIEDINEKFTNIYNEYIKEIKTITEQIDHDITNIKINDKSDKMNDHLMDNILIPFIEYFWSSRSIMVDNVLMYKQILYVSTNNACSQFIDNEFGLGNSTEHAILISDHSSTTELNKNYISLLIKNWLNNNNNKIKRVDVFDVTMIPEEMFNGFMSKWGNPNFKGTQKDINGHEILVIPEEKDDKLKGDIISAERGHLIYADKIDNELEELFRKDNGKFVVDVDKNNKNKSGA